MATTFEIYGTDGVLRASWRQGESTELDLTDGDYFLVLLAPDRGMFTSDVNSLSVHDGELVDADASGFTMHATANYYADAYPEQRFVSSKPIEACGLEACVSAWKAAKDEAIGTDLFVEINPITFEWLGKQGTIDDPGASDNYAFSQLVAFWAMSPQETLTADDLSGLQNAVRERLGIVDRRFFGTSGSDTGDRTWTVQPGQVDAGSRAQRAARWPLHEVPTAKSTPVSVEFSGYIEGASIVSFDCINVTPRNKTAECVQIGIMSLGSEPERFEIMDGHLLALFPDVSFNVWDEIGHESGYLPAAGRADMLRDGRIDEVVALVRDAGGKVIRGNISVRDVVLTVRTADGTFSLTTDSVPVTFD